MSAQSPIELCIVASFKLLCDPGITVDPNIARVVTERSRTIENARLGPLESAHFTAMRRGGSETPRVALKSRGVAGPPSARYFGRPGQKTTGEAHCLNSVRAWEHADFTSVHFGPRCWFPPARRRAPGMRQKPKPAPERSGRTQGIVSPIFPRTPHPAMEPSNKLETVSPTSPSPDYRIIE